MTALLSAHSVTSLDVVHHSDALAWLRGAPSDWLNCVVTSPPYYGLRDYSASGQIGLEDTPEQYVARLVALFREVRRVLRDEGVVWLNLGDSYAGSSMTGGTNSLEGAAKRAGRMFSGGASVPNGLKPKDLIGIPWRVAFALQADGWYLRSDIIWHKPNPMPESVTDRPTKAHEYVFLLTKSERYWYDADAVREPHARLWDETNGGNLQPVGIHKANGAFRERGGAYPLPNPVGRNRRTVWTVPTTKMTLRKNLSQEQRAYVISELLRRGLL